MSNNSDHLHSKTINHVRFLLMVGVVFIHCSIPTTSNDFGIFNFFQTLISERIARISVPLFFVISGYYFFLNKDFNLETYKTSIRKKIPSILVPYLIWNLYTLGAILLVNILFPEFLSGSNKPVIEYSTLDYAKSFYNITMDSYPINIALWFMRDLFVFFIASPLIYIFIRYGKLYSIILLVALWLLNFNWDFDIEFPGLVFFSIGTYLGINNKKLINTEYLKYSIYIALVYVALIIGSFYSTYFFRPSILVGILLVLNVTYTLTQSGRLNLSQETVKSNFFIYVYHCVALLAIVKFSSKLFPPTDNLRSTILYFLCTFITITLGLFIFKIGNKLTPRTMKVLMRERR